MLDIDSGGPLRISTDVGHSVTADSVVLATHAPFAKLTLQLKLAQYRSYVVAGPGAGYEIALQGSGDRVFALPIG